MGTRLSFTDYLHHITSESERFRDALLPARGDEPVPTCPEWKADDLLFHLARVQNFWAHVVAGRLTTDEQVGQVAELERSTEHADLGDVMLSSTHKLLAALRDAEPETRAWSWSTEQTVGFAFRRQALEAVVHRLDAELTMGLRTPVDPALAADGVDEALRVMYGGCTAWGTNSRTDEAVLRISATDTGHRWALSRARLTGTDPDGTAHDEPDLYIAAEDDDSAAAAAITGSAEDLLCWIWNRPTVGPVDQAGDLDLRSAVADILAKPVR